MKCIFCIIDKQVKNKSSIIGVVKTALIGNRLLFLRVSFVFVTICFYTHATAEEGHQTV